MTGRVSRYATDTYYLETCDSLAALGIDADTFAHRHATLLLKPDAAITGRMGAAVSWLLDHDYRIVGAYEVALSRLHLRALWYFNWHRATPERRRLADRLAGFSPSVVLLVTHPQDRDPVSCRLTLSKGPADPTQRTAGQLRFALSAGTYLLNLVHSADDPDDVLRELAIYFPEPTLTDVIRQCAAGTDASDDAVRMAERIESAVQRRGGDLAGAQGAIWTELSRSGETERPQTALEWLRAVDDARQRGLDLDPWFCTVIESTYRPLHRP